MNAEPTAQLTAADCVREAARRQDPLLPIYAYGWWVAQPMRALPEYQEIMADLRSLDAPNRGPVHA